MPFGITTAGMTGRQFWLLVHLGLGAAFIHAFIGGARALIGGSGGVGADRRRRVATTTMAVVAWLTVVSGTWMVYPGYRAPAPAGASLDQFPKAYLLSTHDLSFWHHFAMEWKEHVGWLAPILATAVAVLALRHRELLVEVRSVRRIATAFYFLAFAAALVSSVLGAAINKVAPNQFLS